MAVPSSHLREGVARKLVEWTFPLVDPDGLPVIVASSSMGVALYKACDFDEIGGEKGATEIECREWGGSKAHKHVMMRSGHTKGRRGQE